MAKPNPNLIAALRRAADEIKKSDKYQWGHMGSCNCGYLAQELTDLKASEIHKIAMQRSGDWNDQCEDYCTNSKMPIDLLISELMSNGLQIEDLMKLERLGDSEVLDKLPLGKYLEKNRKEDVVLYMKLWADLLEERYLKSTILKVNLKSKEFIVN
jgi:hypothetical protein